MSSLVTRQIGVGEGGGGKGARAGKGEGTGDWGFWGVQFRPLRYGGSLRISSSGPDRSAWNQSRHRAAAAGRRTRVEHLPLLPPEYPSLSCPVSSVQRRSGQER